MSQSLPNARSDVARGNLNQASSILPSDRLSLGSEKNSHFNLIPTSRQLTLLTLLDSTSPSSTPTTSSTAPTLLVPTRTTTPSLLPHQAPRPNNFPIAFPVALMMTSSPSPSALRRAPSSTAASNSVSPAPKDILGLARFSMWSRSDCTRLTALIKGVLVDT